MTLRNEVMEGITAYRALNPAKTTQDRYYDQLREEAASLEKKGEDAVAAERARRAGLPSAKVPTRASTAVPGATPTLGAPTDSGGFGTATAFNAGAPGFGDQLSRGYRRGGRVTKRFQEGGAVDDRSEADRILEEMLAKNELSENVDPAAQLAERGVTDRADAATDDHERGEVSRRAPVQEDVPIGGEEQRRIAGDRNELTEGGMKRTADYKYPANPYTGPLAPQRPQEDDRRSPARRVVEDFWDRNKDINVKVGTADAPPPVAPREIAEPSALNTNAPPAPVSAAAPAPAPAAAPAPAPAAAPAAPGAPADTVAPKGIVETLLEQTNKDAAARAERRAGRPAPAKPGAEPAVKPPETKALQATVPPRPAGAGDPSVYGRPAGPRSVTGGDPDVEKPTSPTYPPGTPTKPGGGAGTGGGVRTGTGSAGGAGGAGGGTSGPGSGTGAPAPPPPRGREEAVDTRTAAFDPGRERIGPQGQTMARQFDQQGQVVYPSPQEATQLMGQAALAGGVQPGGGASAIGTGAVSRENYRSLIAQNNQGGQLTDGQAAMIAMHAKYRELLRRGKPKEAATMAWGIIQAANLEAASLGMVARDQLQSGDIAGSRKTLATALDHAPDGMNHKATSYGIETSDQNGNVTNRMVVDGKRALQIALGLSDGSLMWEVLQNAVKAQQPVDKNAEGRGLRNDLTRLQIEGARRRLNKLQGGGQGESGEAARLRSILNSGSSNVTAPPRGGSNNADNDSWISASAANSGDDGEDNA